MSSPRPSTESSVSMQDPNAIVDGREFGRLMIDETRSYYTSNMMWASLANEVRVCDIMTSCVFARGRD